MWDPEQVILSFGKMGTIPILKIIWLKKLINQGLWILTWVNDVGNGSVCDDLSFLQIAGNISYLD